MDNNISRDDLFKWCSISYQELEKYKDLKVKLAMKPDRKQTMLMIGNMMADEAIKYNNENRILKWVLPAGPTDEYDVFINSCLLYTSPSPRDGLLSRMPSSA